MFEPHRAKEYFDRAMCAIQSCNECSRVEGLPATFEPNADFWEVIRWRLKITFYGGDSLAIMELHEKQGQSHLRSVSYHLMNNQNECVFRIDNHGKLHPASAPLHIHIGQDMIEDGDPRLNGLSLHRIGFMEVFGWTHQHLHGKQLPWK